MSLKALKFALVGCLVLVAASSLVAAPIVTMQQNAVTDGVTNYNALDFIFTASAGAEFTNYRLIVNTPSGNFIADPNQPQKQFNTGGVVSGAPVDTIMNTPFSAFGAGSASYVFNDYHPGAPPFTPADPQPTNAIDWDVFDTAGGDGGGPFHLARVLILPGGQGSATFTAFDTQSAGIGTPYTFEFGVVPNVDPIVNDYVEAMGINSSDPGSYSHQMTVTDPDEGDTHTWTGPTFVSFAPGFGGGNAPNTQPPSAPTLTSGGLFEWMTVGAGRGTYVWSVNASDGTGSDDGTITLNVTQVPEPGTFALLGLAIVGLVGYARRR